MVRSSYAVVKQKRSQGSNFLHRGFGFTFDNCDFLVTSFVANSLVVPLKT